MRRCFDIDNDNALTARGMPALVLAALLTAASFYVASTDLIWGPSVPAALIVLAIAGSLWIMANLNPNMMPMEQMMRMQR